MIDLLVTVFLLLQATCQPTVNYVCSEDSHWTLVFSNPGTKYQHSELGETVGPMFSPSVLFLTISHTLPSHPLGCMYNKYLMNILHITFFLTCFWLFSSEILFPSLSSPNPFLLGSHSLPHRHLTWMAKKEKMILQWKLKSLLVRNTVICLLGETQQCSIQPFSTC